MTREIEPPEQTPAAGGRLLDNIEEIVSGIALVIVVLSASWGVFTRYLTKSPATWSGEIATLAFSWLVFVGASACFKHGGHVMAVDNFRVPSLRVEAPPGGH